MCMLVLCWITIILLTGFLLFAFWKHPVTTMLFIAAFVVVTVIGEKSYQKRVKYIARTRESEPYAIGNFARLFDCRKVDTWVIRAVYEEVQRCIISPYLFPLNPKDMLLEDLYIDDEDLDDIATDVCFRAGRLTEYFETNPLYGRVKTVEELVMFLNYQPKIETI